jgi:hypothetical protein
LSEGIILNVIDANGVIIDTIEEKAELTYLGFCKWLLELSRNNLEGYGGIEFYNGEEHIGFILECARTKIANQNSEKLKYSKLRFFNHDRLNLRYGEVDEELRDDHNTYGKGVDLKIEDVLEEYHNIFEQIEKIIMRSVRYFFYNENNGDKGREMNTVTRIHNLLISQGINGIPNFDEDDIGMWRKRIRNAEAVKTKFGSNEDVLAHLRDLLSRENQTTIVISNDKKGETNEQIETILQKSDNIRIFTSSSDNLPEKPNTDMFVKSLNELQIEASSLGEVNFYGDRESDAEFAINCARWLKDQGFQGAVNFFRKTADDIRDRVPVTLDIERLDEGSYAKVVFDQQNSKSKPKAV